MLPSKKGRYVTLARFVRQTSDLSLDLQIMKLRFLRVI